MWSFGQDLASSWLPTQRGAADEKEKSECGPNRPINRSADRDKQEQTTLLMTRREPWQDTPANTNPDLW